MKIHLAVAAALATGLVVALIARPWDPEPTSGPAPQAHPSAEQRLVEAGWPADSLMLTLEIDQRGARVIQALRKPGLRVRLPWDWRSTRYRWRVRDAAGALLAEGGFDPGPLCEDPAHVGQPPHVFGDQVLPHVVHTNVKVPDFGSSQATVELARVVGAGEQLLYAERVVALELR
jgi:hypothetical protein